MTAGPGRASLTSLPFRLRIAVVLVMPALVAGGILVAFHAGWTSPPDRAYSAVVRRKQLNQQA